LRGKVYAYSDPLSNSGWLVPQAELRTHGLDPSRFFQKTFFTWAHRKVVEAVASGLADGGSVDGYVWETLNLHHPELTRKTRIVEKSPEFGFPPIVARNDLPEKDVLAMQSMLLGMNGSPSGLELLGRLNLDGFEAGNSTLFDAIRRNMLLVETR
jgi:phosphonate transport system substrate-binding protein